MHSQLALMELPSLNLTPFLLLDPVFYLPDRHCGANPLFTNETFILQLRLVNQDEGKKDSAEGGRD